jgi:hypothetical protein
MEKIYILFTLVQIFGHILPGFGSRFLLDPDPHLSKRLDLDPHKINGDPKHCW